MSLFLANPDLLVLLLLGGLLLIYTEFNLPGTIIPGALGTLCVMLSLFGLSRLPISHAAIGLLLVGLTVMLLEVKAPAHGLLALVGTALLVWGLATLVAAPDGVHPSVAIAAGLAFASITFTLAILAARARRNKFLLGPQAMLGKLGVVRIALAPSGQVEVRGELWQATLAEPFGSAPQGAAVVVREVRNLHLIVAPAEPGAAE